MILVLFSALWMLAVLALTFLPGIEHETRRSWQIDLAAIGAMGVATAGFFWRLLFTNGVWMPAGGGDLAGFLYPTYDFAAEWWQRGVIPLWNPYLFGGMSFVGDIQSSLFYPPNLITFFLTNPLTYRELELLAVLHFFIAGAGMYALLRFGRLTDDGRPLSTMACLAGALAFEFSDLFITHFGNLNLIATAAWLPLIFLFFSLALDKNSITAAATGGIFLAVAFFAGHIQSFLFILLAVGLFAADRAFRVRADARRCFVMLALVIAIGLGISAITLLPNFEMARVSVRTAFTYEDAAQFSLPPIELIGLLVPGFFGRGPQAAWGPWPRVEVGYIGVFPLVLAALGLVLRRNARTWFFALLALVGVLLALGGYAIFHGWLYEFVPGLAQLRAPARFILLLDFGLAVLAAIGFNALTQPLTDAQQKTFRVLTRTAVWIFLLFAVASSAVALAILILGQGQDPVLFARIANAANSLAFFILLLAFSLALLFARARNFPSARRWPAFALALIVFDLFSLGAYVDIGLSDPSAGYRRDDVVNFLRRDTSFYRIDSRTDVEGLWRPDTALLYRLFDVYGDNPLVRSDFDHYWESLGGRDSRLYDLLNVKYVLAQRATPLPAKFQRVFDGASGVSVYRNRDAFPRAWIAYASIPQQMLDRALDMMHDRDIDLRTIVFVAGEGAREFLPNGVTPDDAQITGYGPNEIDLNANAKQDGYLVLSEVYDSGWRAFVDEREVQVFRADYLFRAVLLPAGAHRVSLIYDPLGFRIGEVISGLTVLGVIAGLIYRGRVRREA